MAPLSAVFTSASWVYLSTPSLLNVVQLPAQLLLVQREEQWMNGGRGGEEERRGG